MLTHQATYPVNKASIEKLGADWIKPGNLVSNGAFTLAEFVPNDHIKLVKNPKFYDAANVKIDVVNYYPDRGPLDRRQALRGRRTRHQRRHPDRAACRPARRSSATRSASDPISAPTTTPIKIDKAPWDNVELRHAISMAIDRDFLAEKVWQNSMLPGYSMVPPGIAGYDAGDRRLRRHVADRPRGRGQGRSSRSSATRPTIR